jgi:hypothetical protein
MKTCTIYCKNGAVAKFEAETTKKEPSSDFAQTLHFFVGDKKVASFDRDEIVGYAFRESNTQS